MNTKLTNVALVKDGDKMKNVRSNYNGINPAISNEDAKDVMMALAKLSNGDLKQVERVNKELLYEVKGQGEE